MYVYVVLLAVILTASADKKEDLEKCKSLINIHRKCCQESLFNKTWTNQDNIKECMLIPAAPGSCDREICFGTKEGVATEDGAIKLDILEKKLEEKLSDYKDILQALKKECFHGNYTTYTELDECDIKKMFHCIRWQLIFRCPAYKNEDSCKEIKDTGAKCLELKAQKV